VATAFPLDLSSYHPLLFAFSDVPKPLSLDEKTQLERNIALVRDSIVFMTALAGAKGIGGHTGGAYDVVPEAEIVQSFMRGEQSIFPVLFDEAGHRVALQYVYAALHQESSIAPDDLLHYREFESGLYGHPERDSRLGIGFTSGRLGHLWGYVNGVALAYPHQKVILLGSDGAQQEGNDAEAARFAVAHNLEVKLLIDDNNVTISGHPAMYMKGFSVARTLEGQGLNVFQGDGEQIDSLFLMIQRALTTLGPAALVSKRPMAPGIPLIEGQPKGHDVISLDAAVEYLSARGHTQAVEMLKATKKHKPPITAYLGTLLRDGQSVVSNPRDEFGKAVCAELARMSPAEQKSSVRVFDNDLEGSCGLHYVHKQFPDVFVEGGVMERNNFSAAAGFGSESGRQGIYATFAAFLEMVVSEITMARLSHANVLAHFSHSGPDGMADNTTHYGINNLIADSGLREADTTRLYFPADSHQMQAVVQRVFKDSGLRFIFSPRASLPHILDDEGKEMFSQENGYAFTPEKDEVIRQGRDGYVVSYGDMLHRSLHAALKLVPEGMDVGLINKPTLNICDEEMMARLKDAPFVLVVESQNQQLGLGMRYGTWLLERGFQGRYAHVGTVRPGKGGLFEQIPYQGLAPDDLQDKIREIRP